MTPADLMLLDEPTNHLDLEATVWLQKWLAKYEGTVMMIAHDRDFLDQVADEIVHIEQLAAHTYRGGYSSFEKQRALRLSQQQSMLQQQARERQRIERFIDRFRAKATKARQVQSRIKLLERMPEVAVIRTQLPYKFTFQAPARFDQPMVQIDRCSLGYPDQVVISELTERIYPGDRIGILGINGAGKSTLLKSLAGELTPLDGALELSEHTTVGYFAQHQLELLDGDVDAYRHVGKATEFSDQQIRNFLGAWGFSGDHIYRPVRQFSGGEKARLVLALIALERPALLVLDEPTNHLDLEMREALSIALDAYSGAVVVVAHDQHLLRQCINEFWLVEKGAVTKFDGDLNDYESLLAEPSVKSARAQVQSQRDRRKARAEERNRLRGFIDRRKAIEQSLDELELHVEKLGSKLSDPETLKTVARAELDEWIRDHGQSRKRIAQLEREWMSIEEEISESIGDA